MGKHRDRNGLTSKMNEVLPVMAAQTTKAAGFRECKRRGISIDKAHFKNVWMHDPKFKNAYLAAREKHQGLVSEQIEAEFVASAVEIASNIVKTALSSGNQSMRAAEIAFNVIGIDTGRGNRFSVHTSVNTSATEQDRFAERLQAFRGDRRNRIFGPSDN